MIANVSPSSMSYEDTYNTLNYANRAKNIKTTVVRNVVSVDFHITRYKQIVQDLRGEIDELKAKLLHLERCGSSGKFDPDHDGWDDSLNMAIAGRMNLLCATESWLQYEPR